MHLESERLHFELALHIFRYLDRNANHERIKVFAPSQALC
jgi:hypothetical protein